MNINLDSENQNGSKLKMIAMMIGFGILTWIGSSMPTISSFKKQRFGDMYFIMTKDKPRCNEANKLKMIAMMIGFWILT
jgi:hypothetical protein